MFRSSEGLIVFAVEFGINKCRIGDPPPRLTEDRGNVFRQFFADLVFLGSWPNPPTRQLKGGSDFRTGGRASLGIGWEPRRGAPAHGGWHSTQLVIHAFVHTWGK